MKSKENSERRPALSENAGDESYDESYHEPKDISSQRGISFLTKKVRLSLERSDSLLEEVDWQTITRREDYKQEWIEWKQNVELIVSLCENGRISLALFDGLNRYYSRVFSLFDFRYKLKVITLPLIVDLEEIRNAIYHGKTT